MKLFHGSNVIVKAPQIIEPSHSLDFGKGFYTTSNYDQAARWAKSKSNYEHQQNAFVSVFEIDDNFLLSSELNIKNFELANEQWLDFVINNRKNIDFLHFYDIVKGAVANDKVYASLNAFENGFMNKQTLLEELKTWVYVDQISFHSNRAIELLYFVEFIEVQNK